MDDTLKFLLESHKDILTFLKTRYHLYHLSNVFFRDLHYGVMAYLAWKGRSAAYTPTERLTHALVDTYIKAGILENVARNAFVLNYPEFKKPPVKPAAPTKPAATAPAAQRPPTGPPAAKPTVVADAASASQPGSGTSDQRL